jgi:hypothetical protein
MNFSSLGGAASAMVFGENARLPNETKRGGEESAVHHWTRSE